MLTNTLLIDTLWILRRAFKKKRVQLWKDLEHRLLSPRSNKSEINISKLANITIDGQTIVVPGKVLGSGSIDHKLVVCAFSISQGAAKKIIDSGGRIITISELTESYSDGNGVRIIG